MVCSPSGDATQTKVKKIQMSGCRYGVWNIEYIENSKKIRGCEKRVYRGGIGVKGEGANELPLATGLQPTDNTLNAEGSSKITYPFSFFPKLYNTKQTISNQFFQLIPRLKYNLDHLS